MQPIRPVTLDSRRRHSVRGLFVTASTAAISARRAAIRCWSLNRELKQEWSVVVTTNAYNYEKQSPTSGRGIGRRVTKPKAKIPSALHLAKGYPILRLQHISCPG